MANRRRSTRRRRRAPIRRAAWRAMAPAETTGRSVAATDAAVPVATSTRSSVSLPSLPHLRRDLTLSLALGLALVVIVVGLATG